MHNVELSNAVLACDESAVEAILERDPSQALTVDELGQTLLITAVSLGNEAGASSCRSSHG
ncbi:MAG: hypothetical protein JO316_21680 [Abitibacteriaceae bacterium]|nr:hypothetical protein [Abditibacteriaceae bacterium]MBV9867975.1 hypothetical protein [Abditibacteriaceae bacterium]